MQSLMINKIEGGNRSKAMNKLRVPPLNTRAIDRSSLFGGWLMGVIFILLVTAVIMCE